MKFSKWTFLQYIITRAARRQGFLDPIELLTRLRSFAQPSEGGGPVELLRAGVVFHARGLINSRVIQYNLDWVWPYWVERQYPRYQELMDAVAGLATPTDQWPEAIYPHTRGGCMGDGHHVWAAAEWVLMIRNCFVREEGERLILCAGVAERWLQQGSPVLFGPAPTIFGPVSNTLNPLPDAGIEIVLRMAWHGREPVIEVHLPGHEPVTLERISTTVIMTRKEIPT